MQGRLSVDHHSFYAMALYAQPPQLCSPRATDFPSCYPTACFKHLPRVNLRVLDGLILISSQNRKPREAGAAVLLP